MSADGRWRMAGTLSGEFPVRKPTVRFAIHPAAKPGDGNCVWRIRLFDLDTGKEKTATDLHQGRWFDRLRIGCTTADHDGGRRTARPGTHLPVNR